VGVGDNNGFHADCYIPADAKSNPYNCTQHNCHGSLGEKFVFEPYTEEMFQQVLQFAEK